MSSKVLPALVLTLAAGLGQTGGVVPAAAQAWTPASLACGNPEFRGYTLPVDASGTPRQFCMHVPGAFGGLDLRPPMPVLIAFHEAGGAARSAVDLVDHLTEQGIVLIAPTALPTEVRGSAPCVTRWRHLGADIPTWAEFGTPNPGCGAAGPVVENGNDLMFVDALIDAIRSQDTFEAGGVYALGFSDGAGMVMQLMITDPLARRFAGFGSIAEGINAQKAAAAELGSGTWAIYGPNPRTRAPAMLVWGLRDKAAFPADRVVARLDALFAATPPAAGCAWSDPPRPADVIGCMMAQPMGPGPAAFDFPSRIDETTDWLVGYNGALPRAIESVYPDKGHGPVPLSLQDATVAVRQDYLAGGPDAGAVAVISVLGGEHVVPGATGAHAPCESRNCDFRAVDEIIDFFRAYGGFVNLWR